MLVDDLGEYALSLAEGFVGHLVPRFLDEELLQLDLLDHALVTISLSVKALRPLGLELGVVLADQPIGELLLFLLLQEHRLDLILAPFLPLLQPLHGLVLLELDLLLPILLLRLEPLVQSDLFGEGILLALLADRSDLGGHLVPPL